MWERLGKGGERERITELQKRLTESSPVEGKDDAALFLLVNPSTRDIARMVTEAHKTERFSSAPRKFHGLRAIKLRDEKKRTLCIVWPSFCWIHHHVITAAKQSFPGFEVVAADTAKKFNFDEQSRRFSAEQLKKIGEWMKEGAR